MRYTRKRTSDHTFSDALSSVASGRTISLFSLFLIIVALPVTIFLMNHQTEVQSHAAGTSLPPDGQGIYDTCTPWGTTDPNHCFSRLDQMATGGFKLVVNYNQMWGDAPGIIAYLNHAQADGMKVIFAMNDPALWNGTNLLTYYSGLAATCTVNGVKCQTNTDFSHLCD